MGEQLSPVTVVGVIGAGSEALPIEVEQFARAVGGLIARRGYLLLTGGRTGVMLHASRGAKEAGGQVIGVLPGNDTAGANPYVDIPIVTGISDARNLINVLSSRVVIAFPGGGGTLSEIGLALKNRIPVIDCGGWQLSNSLGRLDRMMYPAKDVDTVEQLLGKLLSVEDE